jgi:hypothetical protein
MRRVDPVDRLRSGKLAAARSLRRAALQQHELAIRADNRTTRPAGNEAYANGLLTWLSNLNLR